MNQFSKTTLLAKMTHKKYSHWKQDIFKYTNWMKFNEGISKRLECYINSVTKYAQCEFGNDKPLGSKLCKTYGCECRSKIYKKSNLNRDNSWSSDNLKRQWNKFNENIESSKLLSKKEVTKLLLSKRFNYKKYFGKLGNRKLILDNASLYKSILHYTKSYPKKVMKNLTAKLLLAAKFQFDDSKIRCKYCDKLMTFDANKKMFGKVCQLCYIKYDQKIFQCSKSSLKLFNNIANKIDKKKCYYGKSQELLLRLPNKNKRYYDFTYNNKIIEFNGDMWHMNPLRYKQDDVNPKNKMIAKDVWMYDKEKIQLAKEKGYEVLVIWESDYKSNPDQILQKCLEFLND